jgi:glutamate dehydrogenase
MSGEEASLTNAFISLCHTALAHNQPDRYDLEVVKSAFHSDPEIALKLVDAFKKKFDPDNKNRERESAKALDEVEKEIEIYNTGQRYLDEVRKTIFRTCALFISYTLKTNFFVPEKHAISFRLDPAYLAELDPEFTSDLPEGVPFRITFFFGRTGVGYHIGFSDIARGGWRTIICRNEDELLTSSNTLFREVFVLAHTQHLKNKDIYEGGSKLTVVLNASGAETPDSVTQLLYKTQYAFANAFLDIFVTEDGKAKHPRVVDYYGEDEPIELGPDENMHDSMIETIARRAVEREYLLGIGLMSSKEVGINHKEYGVTSRGMIKSSEIAMNRLGIDIHKDPFTVKITGGTNGDVAGNGMRLLIERCPKAKLVSIAAGSGALYDPEGANHEELGRLVLKEDITDFNPKALAPGGFILFRRQRRKEGLREMYRKLSRTESGVEEDWIISDEFYREFNNLIFDVPADLFLPCGGRPETIDENNWQRLLGEDGTPNTKAIVEGANSYITPEARVELQKKGVIVLRDASANKCGVISSSYEIIANLLMKEKEFLENKEAYVSSVLDILDKRAEEEATLIFERHSKNEGRMLYTEIANSISEEINADYAALFTFFQERPELLEEQLFRSVLLGHLPAFIRDSQKFKARTKKLPAKIQYAILAAEIATAITYRGGWKADFEHQLRGFLKRKFS